MIKLKSIVSEIQSQDSYKLHDKIVKAQTQVLDYLKKNKEELLPLVMDDNWEEVYKIVFAAFPDLDQADMATVINTDSLSLTGWLSMDPDEIIKDLDHTHGVRHVFVAVNDWVKKNKAKLIKLADADDYDAFYKLAKDKFPKVPEEKLLHALKLAAVENHIHYDIVDP
jgi:23S rRNA U2552 (ribose-2'-O)-methylase RlmE/FtsJ